MSLPDGSTGSGLSIGQMIVSNTLTARQSPSCMLDPEAGGRRLVTKNNSGNRRFLAINPASLSGLANKKFSPAIAA